MKTIHITLAMVDISQIVVTYPGMTTRMIALLALRCRDWLELSNINMSKRKFMKTLTAINLFLTGAKSYLEMDTIQVAS